MEAGKMKFLTAGMKELTTDEEKVAARLKMLMLGFRKVRGNNDKYAYTFCLLEVVNFVNVILQVILISTLSTLYLHVQVSLPILIGGVLIARNMILPSFVIICLGMIFLNFNWSVSVDMTMWVTC